VETRPFSAHLTLARASELNFEERTSVSNGLDASHSFRAGPWVVDEARLMRSELSPGGPRYQLIQACRLAGTAPPGEFA
jgi:2'-5' RNA ligase